MSVSVTVIRAGLPRTCTTQAELASALGIACTVENGLGVPRASLDDVDVEAVGAAAAFRVTDEPYGTDYTLRPDVQRQSTAEAA